MQHQQTDGGEAWVARALLGQFDEDPLPAAERVAEHLVAKGLSRNLVYAVLLGFSERCDRPLSTRDLRKIADRAQPRVAAGDGAAPALQHVGESLTAALAEIDSPRAGISTPFAALNHIVVGGFRPGELIYLGARPGVGKTAMALEMARHAAKQGVRVAIVSREMLAAALARRMIAQEGRIPASDLKLGRVDRAAAASAASRLADLPIWISDSARSLADVARATDAVPGGAQLLICDYLQLIQAPREIRDRRLQVESVSQGLKALALARQVPILCLSSLSRPPSGSSPEPSLASLRESGELEHDADIVAFLHRPSADDDGANEVVLIVAKNRDGGIGRARLTFRPEFVSFRPFDPRGVRDE